MNTALQNTERIKSVFLETQLFCAKHDDMPALIKYLEQAEKDFSSIAYESASMAIALKSFAATTFPDEWLLFVNGPATDHQAQVYVGLGWAIAKSNTLFSTAVKKLDPRFYFRIADGCGYYDGSFKHRQTVINKQLPGYLPIEALPMYYQGVGRSIWYTQKADIHAIADKVESFGAERHADLWRGIGIAIAYVGGCDDADLKLLFQYAGAYSFQLSCGAALVARSRTLANTMTADTDRCSRLWYSLTMDDNSILNEDVYYNWIMQIEETLSKSFEPGP
jgi:hypothetical protein